MTDHSKDIQPLSLPFEHAANNLQVALQRSVDLVSFGLQAADSPSFTELRVPGADGHVDPARGQAMDVSAAQAAFRSWVLACGLRECVEALGPCLEWARKHCYMWTRPGSVTALEDGRMTLHFALSGEQWNREVITGAKKFDRLPLPEKFTFLEREFGLGRPELTDHILSINAARNCLAHRAGRVGPADLKQPGDTELQIRWRKLQIVAEDPQGNRRVVSMGDVVEAGSGIAPEFADTERRVAVGSTIQFSPQDYVELSMTFLLFALELQSNLNDLQERRRPTDSQHNPQPKSAEE